MIKFKKCAHYTLKPKKQTKRRAAISFSILCIVVGLYIFWILQAANLKPLTDLQQANFIPHEIKEKQLIIPKIAVNSEIFQGQADVLERGIWNRFPERGTPDMGGNFILSGHRFVFDKTPQKTKQKSYLYNIDKLVEGDTILVDWRHKRYKYKIVKIYSVNPNAIEIEEPSKEAKLTLYTCTLQGQADGRIVIEAKPVE